LKLRKAHSVGRIAYGLSRKIVLTPGFIGQAAYNVLTTHMTLEYLCRWYNVVEKHQHSVTEPKFFRKYEISGSHGGEYEVYRVFWKCSNACRPRLTAVQASSLGQWYSTFFVRVPPDIISLQL
jgi:hypothetical protein